MLFDGSHLTTPTPPPGWESDRRPPNASSADSWLPRYSGDLSALASLSVCHVNTDAGCDFHAKQKSAEYRRAWGAPGPVYCRPPSADADAPVVIHADRLGLACRPMWTAS